MNATLLHITESQAQAAVARIDQLMNWPNIQPIPAAELAKLNKTHLRLWCHVRAVYQLPTTEFVDQVGEMIDKNVSRTEALESGAGTGSIGKALGIRMTDNYMQTWPAIQHYYQSIGQPTIEYGASVEKIDAEEAVKQYKPRIVLGCWITERYRPGKDIGNAYGPDERAILQNPSVQWYMICGTQPLHRTKAILNELRPPHWRKWEIAATWLWSRAEDQTQNRIWILERLMS